MDLDIRFILVAFLALTISLVVHEFAHAIVADKLGDDTPRRHDRLTLNPMVIWQAHPVGSLVVPLLSAAMGGLMGWAATPVNPSNVRRDISLRAANFMIAAAGPASNVLLAILGIGLWYGLVPFAASKAFWVEPILGAAGAGTFTLGLLPMLVACNIILAIFNLIPIAPLDGHAMLSSYAPREWEKGVEFLSQYGMILLILLVMYGGHIFGPAVGWWYRLVFSSLMAAG